ncbi:MAG: methyl-accepting chemotaxis protein [Treponema sp.]|jgi:methyl-accepting chemotaxis protein|nr:methyl-accepting chemotaxis protein [Treponema sp.]
MKKRVGKRRYLSIKVNFFIFSLVFFLLILTGGTGAFFLSMGQIIRSNLDQELARMLETRRLRLEASVNSEIAIAIKMAGSPLIQRYFLDPGNPVLEALALEEIAGYRRAFAGNSVFWVNDIDKRFYSDDAYSYTVDPDNPADYWYKMTLYETEVYNFNINYNENINKTLLWINAPVFDNGKPTGMLGTGIDLTGFIDSVYTGFDANSVDLYLFNDLDEITGALDSTLVLNKKTVTEHLGEEGGKIAGAARTLGETEVKTFRYARGQAAVIRVPRLNWYMAAFMPFTFSMYFNTTMTVLFFAMLTVILLVFVISNLYIAKILKPLKFMVKLLSEISVDWDLTRRLDIHNRDEFGELSEFLNRTFEKMKELIGLIKTEAVSLSSTGTKLTLNMAKTRAAVDEISSHIQNMQGQINSQAIGVSESGGAMERITKSLEKLNEHINEQADSVTQSSAAIEEMLANIHSVTGTLVNNAGNVATLAESSESGKTGLGTVFQDIQEIARESEGLLEINSVMQNISSQTNLLSMNAAIEAAHAGEAGRGFAVVADEIRKLAESSGEQSKTISTVLKKIKTSIDTITGSTGTALKGFEAIEDRVKTVSEQEEHIRTAMEEQEIGSRQILDAISRLKNLTEQVKSESTAMARTSEDTLKQQSGLELISGEVAQGMNEMIKGAEQINAAVVLVNGISGENERNIEALSRAVAAFKVE